MHEFYIIGKILHGNRFSKATKSNNYPIIWIEETLIDGTGSVIPPISTVFGVKLHATHVKIVFAPLYVYL